MTAPSNIDISIAAGNYCRFDTTVKTLTAAARINWKLDRNKPSPIGARRFQESANVMATMLTEKAENSGYQ